MNSERELFEAWAYKNKWNINKFSDGRYVDEFVNGAWLGWQASRNREGYKLVPINPTDKMKLAAYKQYDSGLSSMKDLYKAMVGAVDE